MWMGFRVFAQLLLRSFCCAGVAVDTPCLCPGMSMSRDCGTHQLQAPCHGQGRRKMFDTQNNSREDAGRLDMTGLARCQQLQQVARYPERTASGHTGGPGMRQPISNTNTTTIIPRTHKPAEMHPPNQLQLCSSNGKPTASPGIPDAPLPRQHHPGPAVHPGVALLQRNGKQPRRPANDGGRTWAVVCRHRSWPCERPAINPRTAQETSASTTRPGAMLASVSIMLTLLHLMRSKGNADLRKPMLVLPSEHQFKLISYGTPVHTSAIAIAVNRVGLALIHGVQRC